MAFIKRKFEFGTKAETLERLTPHLEKSRVPELMKFRVGDWKSAGRTKILSDIARLFSKVQVIVRSSAFGEDGNLTAQAGTFLSVPDVSPSDAEAVAAAVDEVITSYGKLDVNEEISGDNQVIVQEMISEVAVSGVIFTQEITTGAAYYVINYDDESGRTETITAGTGYTNRTLYAFRDKWRSLTSPRFVKILEAVQEIEQRVGHNFLDIEFALDTHGTVHIFQVRQITTRANWNRRLTIQIRDTLDRLAEGLQDHYGDNDMDGAILGNMPDWNPAEMIGTTPRPLALSLYRHLITDRAWRIARREMGYSENPGAPLMLSLAGQPYIDVRESFRSFIPANFDEALGRKLVCEWLARLRRHHYLHDKIEFEVAIAELTPDFDIRMAKQMPGMLSNGETKVFRAALRDLTNSWLCGRVASIDDQLARIETLAKRRQRLISSMEKPSFQIVISLLEDAIEFGTIPFSILARHGFIAISMLRGLEARGVLTSEEISRFQQAVPTVAAEFIHDVDRHARGQLTKSELLSRYGHLRPGTYDILSLRYDQRLTEFNVVVTEAKHRPEPFELHPRQIAEINRLLQAEGYDIDTDGLLLYCSAAIKGREFAKFAFTRNVSDSLEVIGALGERYDLSREELSYIEFKDFIETFVVMSGRSIEGHLRELSERGSQDHQVTSALRLPFLITSLSDLAIVPLAIEHPNYVTRKRVRGPVAVLSNSSLDAGAIDDKIVAIESADPGYDWIFTRRIQGLITRFGGANSHMAIRCAEFGLPAAIGCGEQIFDRVVNSDMVELNCTDGRIVVG